jgi:cation transport ATPase
MFRDKFWLSLALTIPVVFWSTDIQHWLGYTAPTFPGSKFIPPILGTVVFVYGGLVFIRGARSELAELKPGMMTLISLGIIAAFGTSLAGTFGLFDIDVWWELTSLITISDPRDVVGAIELSRATYRKMIQNLVWATAYNLIAIPAAAGLFVRWGVELPMSVGAVAMNSSTIIVAVNAQLLRRLKLQRDTPVVGEGPLRKWAENPPPQNVIVNN